MVLWIFLDPAKAPNGLLQACLFSPRGYAFASGNGTMISA
jgi:hypothetical protein